MKENGEKEAAGKLPPALCITEVKSSQVCTGSGLYRCSVYMKLPKKMKLKAITRTKWEETKNCKRKQQKREMQENRGCMMNSVGAMNNYAGTKFHNAPFFFTFCSSFLLGSDLQR